ncbi:MAG: alpha,alpha-trehalose-phosphate synthase (UDP-forming) [Candidatus Deferrimicrobiaceae bacterium]
MKITLRLVVSLVLVVGLVAAGFSFFQVREERIRLTSDLERRSIILAESIQESVIPLVTSDSSRKLDLLVQRFGKRERFQGVAVHDARGQILASTADLEPQIPESVPQVVHVLAEGHPTGSFLHSAKRRIYLYTSPLLLEEKAIGVLTLFHDASYIDVRLEEIWRHNLIRFLILSVLVVAITLIVVRWSITGPIAQMAGWIKELRTGKTRTVKPIAPPKMGPALDPLISEVSHLAKSLAAARAKAEKISGPPVQAESLWTARRLKEQMSAELDGKKLVLVSNREPYIHEKDGPGIRCVVPAGGLVTALDPVMRVCDGLWIAHGSGDADRETVDGNDTLRVPPGEPAYTLKRVWLTKEEEDGYYYGFANEGLWPLCHITHNRPEFRLEDWTYYRQVNEKFATALLTEIAGEESPVVLVQDYHLALLPSLIKEKRPDVKVAIFWHIPWPNPEAYGICPWRQEILQGMLGADIIGFHIQFHCNNFLETVDRFLESKIDWEQFSVTREGHTTLIKPFPISVSLEHSSGTTPPEGWPTKEDLLRKSGVRAEYLGVGVDRIDYTKGIPERFRAIERFFEKYPEYLGRFTFMELGAPSRTHIKKYRDLMADIEEMVEKVNWRFQTKTWKPIVFLKAQHTHEAIEPYYKGSDLCMVTSLHDGMNLVAKEFVSSRDDEDGVLILSQFTGASRELKDALIVNPYDIEQMADAIFLSLRMEPEERSERMGRMRANIREYNIYRWAGKLIGGLARLRLTDETSTPEAAP